MTIHHLHIFLSSPGDVSRERQLAREVIDRIESERAYRDRIKLEVVAWDKPGAGTAVPAQMEPQEAIDLNLRKPSQCDIVVVIFWARMGTLLSENYLKTDGSRYRSGTEYEYLEALGAPRKSSKPDVLVYRTNYFDFARFGPEPENAHQSFEPTEWHLFFKMQYFFRL